MNNGAYSVTGFRLGLIAICWDGPWSIVDGPSIGACHGLSTIDCGLWTASRSIEMEAVSSQYNEEAIENDMALPAQFFYDAATAAWKLGAE
jgi:hypothetical protein